MPILEDLVRKISELEQRLEQVAAFEVIGDRWTNPGDVDTYLEFTDDQIDAYAGGVNLFRLDETTQDVVYLGDVAGTGDVDVNLNNGAFFIRGSDGRIGIATTDPESTLDVNGDIRINEFLIHNDDADTYLQFTDDQIDLVAGGVALLRLDETTQDVVYIGDVAGTGDVDVNLNNGAFFIRGSDGRVGIATTDPSSTLDVNGDIRINEFLIHNGDADTYLQFTDDQIDLVAGGLTLLRLDETTQDIVYIGDVAGTGDVDINLNNGQAFIRGSDGDIGIGTSAPNQALEISRSGEESGLSITGDNTQNQTIYFGYPYASTRFALYRPASTDDMRIWHSVGGDLVTIDDGGNVGIGATEPGSLMEFNLTTEDLEIVDAGSSGATEQDWIEVQVGGNTGYIRVFATQ